MFKSYRQNTEGNVAMMFSVSFLAILVCVGAAIDFSSATRQKQNLQDIVDSATLAAAKSNSTKENQLKGIVKKFVEEHNNGNKGSKGKKGKKSQSGKISFEVKLIDDQVHVTGTATYDTLLMGIVGRDNIDIVAQAASPIAALTPVKVALVLDTTESMSGADLDALKIASKGLLDELQAFKSPVAVSVVPFGQYVNVGTSRKGTTWLDVADDGKSETKEVCRADRRTITPQVCTPTGQTITYDIIRDGRYMGEGSYEEKTCTGGETELTGTTTCSDRTTTQTWYGCVGSRPAPLDEQASFGTTRIKGVMNQSCGTEIQELTKSFGKANSTIQSMTASGNTYLPAGVIWGWRTLQDEEPLKTKVDLSNGKKKKADPEKVMVFMTDGANTLSQGGSEAHRHDAKDSVAADNKTLALCTAAKAEGIQIYTIGYRMDDASDATRQLLVDCATSPDQYKDAKDAAELKKVFKELAGSLNFARLAM
jgi:Flp pilus assembly protein TadG